MPALLPLDARVLLVDDRRADARRIADQLEDATELRAGVTCVQTLEEGIAAAPRHDVVMLDLSLPDASGVEAVTRMIAAARSLPIVVLTDRRDEQLGIAAVAAGAQDYLHEDDVTPALLAKTLRCAIERKKAGEHAQRLAHTGDALELATENARLLADAQRAVRARDELLAIVSHDLRNPLGVVDLALDLLVRDPERSDLALPRAQRAVDRMKRLIEDLLEVSRIDAGTLQIDPKPTDLGPLLDELAEQHRVLCADKGVLFARDIAADLGTLDADRHRLAQVIANLLGNALELTPEGGHVVLVAHGDRDHVTLAVSDTGAGIAPDHLAHIFDRFWRAPDRRRGGVGLGLAIVKGIVDAHCGTIAVESTLGKGTTFRVTLPRAR